MVLVAAIFLVTVAHRYALAVRCNAKGGDRMHAHPQAVLMNLGLALFVVLVKPEA